MKKRKAYTSELYTIMDKYKRDMVHDFKSVVEKRSVVVEQIYIISSTYVIYFSLLVLPMTIRKWLVGKNSMFNYNNYLLYYSIIFYYFNLGLR